ncbi:hypothetical protein DFJ43DRAFT_1066007 [Lentinula guzmanii]|uniref:DUF6534 domain-containing protein n=1 Tax=Lentinula guzmanii TaxID=2804957 RepID=A0AA38N2P5_9AGAR|nr:hypothetical protein DFJ43DRAFT_1066007 [Lentinula guzmanii]
MSYGSTLGMLEIGAVISSILFGILTMQIYYYQKNYSQDLPWIKYGLVPGIWVIELVHTICIVHAIYFYSVIHFGDAEALDGWPVSFAIAVICHGIVAVLVQGFFAYRIARFTGHFCIVLVPCFGVMIFELVSDIVIGVEMATIARQSHIPFQDNWEWLILTVLCLRTTLDVLISGAFVYHLMKWRNDISENTLAVIDKLILWTIETGLVLSLISILIIICYTTIPENYTWLTLYVILPRVFSNTMLANLNSRNRLEVQQTVQMSNHLNSDSHLDGSTHFALYSGNSPTDSLNLEERQEYSGRGHSSNDAEYQVVV